MRTKLQKVCLVIGALLLVFVFAFGAEVPFTSSVSLRIAYWTLFVIIRLGVVVLAGYVANSIKRGEFLFIVFALLLPGPALVVLVLIKPKIIIEDGKQEA